MRKMPGRVHDFIGEERNDVQIDRLRLLQYEDILG